MLEHGPQTRSPNMLFSMQTLNRLTLGVNLGAMDKPEAKPHESNDVELDERMVWGGDSHVNHPAVTWTHSVSLELTCTQLDATGFTRIYLDSLGNTCTS